MRPKKPHPSFTFSGLRRLSATRRTPILAKALVTLGALFLVAPATPSAALSLPQSLAAARNASAVGIASRPPPQGKPLGRLQIPRVGLDLVIFEGVSDATLRKGPGHIPETAWPAFDRSGYHNCVIAGHRDSFFRPLRNARRGDIVRLVELSGAFRTYRLESKRIVLPEEESVMGRTAEPRLTLITCYPFHYVGDAPYRLVWTAVPVRANARAARQNTARAAQPLR